MQAKPPAAALTESLFAAADCFKKNQEDGHHISQGRQTRQGRPQTLSLNAFLADSAHAAPARQQAPRRPARVVAPAPEQAAAIIARQAAAIIARQAAQVPKPVIDSLADALVCLSHQSRRASPQFSLRLPRLCPYLRSLSHHQLPLQQRSL